MMSFRNALPLSGITARAAAICLLTLYALQAGAQDLKISGTVRDADSHQPLPYVNIRVAQSALGTTSDKNGRYQLSLSPGTYEIRFTYIGYGSVHRTLTLPSEQRLLDVDLRQGEVLLDELVVTPQDNPALAIIRRAIESKERARELLRSYMLTSHSKLVATVKRLSGARVSINDITADSTVTGIVESQTDAYWEQPDHYKEIIRARKQSAFIPAAGNLLASRFFIIDFSADLISIGETKIVGPVSASGLDRYFYRLIGTTTMGEDSIYAIAVTPIDDADPLLQGKIYIAHNSYRLMAVEVDLNRAARPPFFSDLSFRQQFARFDSAFWMPVDVVVRGDISVSMIVSVDVHFEAFSVLQNYRINTPLPEGIFDRTRLQVLPEADKRDSGYWASHAAIPNSPDELEQYRKSDSIKANLEARRNEIGLMDLLTGKSFGWDRTSLSVPGAITLYRFNRVEGHGLSVPISLREPLPGLRLLETDLGYGFSDRRMTYAVSGNYRFPTRMRATLSGSIFSDLGWIENGPFDLAVFPVTALNLLWKYDNKDYYFRRGWSAGMGGDILPVLSGSIRFTETRYADAPRNTDWSILRRERDFRPNPPINEGTVRSLTATLNLDTREFIDNAGTLSRMGGRRNMHFPSISLEMSEPSLFGSAYRFAILGFALTGNFDAGLWGNTSYRLSGRVGFGALPTQKAVNFPGAIPWLTAPWSFRTLDFREFSGDRAAIFFIEHHFDDILFRRLSLPLLKESGWDLVFFGGAGWSDMAEKSRRLQTVPVETARAPFYEAGVGLDRIFLLFRIDAAWRLSHYREGRNFALGVSIPFF